MKTTLKQALTLVLLVLFGTITVSAATIYVDGIKYTTTTSTSTAVVVKYDSKVPDGIYKGEIVIPSSVLDGGIQYTVVGINPNAFLDCVDLTKITIPETCVTIGRNAFKGCTGLLEYPVPLTATSIGQGAFLGCSSIKEAYIPSGVTGKLNFEEFGGCTSLTKFTVMDSDEPLEYGLAMFGVAGTPRAPLEEVYSGRTLIGTYGAPFAKTATIKKLTVGDKVTALQSNEFISCPALEDVTLGSGLTSIGASAFAGASKLKLISIPAGVTAIQSQTFSNCSSLANVEFKGAVTTIANYAFNNCALENFSIPASVTTIGEKAFYYALRNNNLDIPNGLTTIGEKAFFGATVSGIISIPASVTNVGQAAFGLVKASGFEVASGSTSYKENTDILLTFDGKTIVANAPESPLLKIIDEIALTGVENIMQYGLALVPIIQKIDMPDLKSIENYAFYSVPVLPSFTITGNVALGTNVFENSALTSIEFGEGITTIPASFCKGSAKLATVKLPKSLNVIMLGAFEGCVGLKSMVLESNLNYMETGAIPTTISEITCKNINVPIITENLFNAEMKDVICNVAESAVADYKNAMGWNFLNIQGDVSITGKKEPLGCPTGLYFATKTGELMFLDEKGVIENTGIPSGLHAFQLGAAHNRVYVGYAGRRFTYSGTPANEGEGELFYLNRSGESFYRVTLVSNIGYHAFEDVFSLSVDAAGHKLLVADRNVGVHVIDTERPGLYGQQPFLLQNNWLPWYNKGIMYGAIGCGMLKDSKGVYWMGKKFNGNGIFRFTDADIYPEGGEGKEIPNEILFEGVTMTTFYLDEVNKFLYVYLQVPLSNENTVVPGVYRFNLSDIETLNGGVKFAEHGTLIDASPILQEGTAPSELTGVTQITGNGVDIYWSYIAPKTAEDLYIGAQPLDVNNPLHKSGIKKVSAKGDDLTVTYAVENVEAYGVVAANYVHSGVENNVVDKTENKCVVRGTSVEISQDAKVRIYSVNGALCSQKAINGNGTVSVDGFEKGMYVIHIAYTDGSADVVKIIK